MSTPQRILSKMAGYRQIEVAEHLGVSRSCLAGWLAGYSTMPDDALLKVHRLVSERLDGTVSQKAD
jgi:hypothetical protein